MEKKIELTVGELAEFVETVIYDVLDEATLHTIFRIHHSDDIIIATGKTLVDGKDKCWVKGWYLHTK